MCTDLIRNVDKTNKYSYYKDIIKIVDYDFKKLSSNENKNFKLKNYVYGDDIIVNWFQWQKINIELEENDRENGWKNGFSPDNCWSCKTLHYIYKKLDWCDNDAKPYSDAINSFFTTYTLAILYHEEEITSLNNNSVIFGHNGKDFISVRKLLENDKFQNYKVINEIDCLQTLTKLTHTIGNFTPCYDGEFNSAKGIIPEVKDFLPLMVDKIEKCIEEDKDISYNMYGNKKSYVHKEVLKEWKDYLIYNREKFLLEDYYYIQEQNGIEKMVGIPMFKTQSLEHPIPLDKEELEECIKEMRNRIYNRGLRMVCKIISNI